MTERCLTIGCPDALRVSLQDICSGSPVAGLCNGYVMSCIRNWSITPIVREGDASEFVSDCGGMVNRDRQDDQLLGYTISFETSVRSSELESLLTGKEIIESGGISIGTYGIGSALTCSDPSPDPRFIVEAFYKLSNCDSNANHVRWVLPMAQFKVTELDKEGTITFYRYTAETGISLASAIGSGPFMDFPDDVTSFISDLDPTEYTTGFDFEESIEISGQCGCIVVEDNSAPNVTAMSWSNDSLIIDGTNLLNADGDVGLSWVGGGGSSWTLAGHPRTLLQTDTQIILDVSGFGPPAHSQLDHIYLQHGGDQPTFNVNCPLDLF